MLPPIFQMSLNGMQKFNSFRRYLCLISWKQIDMSIYYLVSEYCCQNNVYIFIFHDNSSWDMESFTGQAQEGWKNTI